MAFVRTSTDARLALNPARQVPLLRPGHTLWRPTPWDASKSTGGLVSTGRTPSSQTTAVEQAQAGVAAAEAGLASAMAQVARAKDQFRRAIKTAPGGFRSCLPAYRWLTGRRGLVTFAQENLAGARAALAELIQNGDRAAAVRVAAEQDRAAQAERERLAHTLRNADIRLREARRLYVVARAGIGAANRGVAHDRVIPNITAERRRQLRSAAFSTFNRRCRELKAAEAALAAARAAVEGA